MNVVVDERCCDAAALGTSLEPQLGPQLGPDSAAYTSNCYAAPQKDNYRILKPWNASRRDAQHPQCALFFFGNRLWLWHSNPKVFHPRSILTKNGHLSAAFQRHRRIITDF
jgi:hypothetical protein